MNPIDQESIHENKMETIYTRANPVFQDSGITGEVIHLINRLAPKPLSAEQVYVRSMFLCSNQLCLADGCRFTRNGLEEIAQKIIGQSVLTGHNRTSLPLARFFKAQVVQKGEDAEGEPVLFVQAWFYWLRETSGAKDLLLNIDGGVYREVSLAWKYNRWRCSICHAENGMCPHRVGERYDDRLCYRLIDHIVDVLEGSLVYKSADRNTFLSGMRGAGFGTEDEPVFLICENDDPLLSFLESNNLITDKQNFSESCTAYKEGINFLWLRSQSPKLYPVPDSFLTEKGVAILETVPQSSGGKPLFGEIEMVLRSHCETELNEQPLFDWKED